LTRTSLASLHPLARQAVEASQNPEVFGWAYGLTYYLAHFDPAECVTWTVDSMASILRPSGPHAELIGRGLDVLKNVLVSPAGSDLKLVDNTASQLWSMRHESGQAGPVARLLWATKGAILKREPVSEPNDLSQPNSHDDGRELTGFVWDQCGLAIMMAIEEPSLVLAIAQSFTAKVCHREPPSIFQVVEQFSWAWEKMSYEIRVLRLPDQSVFVEYTDPQGDGPLYSRNFQGMSEAKEHLDQLVCYSPKTVRFTLIK
jgi:hypothetical protein